MKIDKRVDEIQRRCVVLLEQKKSWEYINAMVQLMANKESVFMKQGLLDFGEDFEADMDHMAKFTETCIRKLSKYISIARSGNKLSAEDKKKAAVLRVWEGCLLHWLVAWRSYRHSFRRWRRLGGAAEADGTWLKAPNGERSNLPDELWCAVRTKAFKAWFGDWEAYAQIQEIENMPAVEIMPHESLDKKQMKEVFRGFGELRNESNGRVIVFPASSAGKILGHGGFDTSCIAKELGALYENSLFAFSEAEILKEGHKVHRNVEAYEHYVNKFTSGESEYFIRFTVPVIKNNRGASMMHSTAISDVEIYKAEALSMDPANNPGMEEFRLVDNKLKDFFNSVKFEEVSKVVDENGEPLLVYHGTTELFDAFDMSKGRANMDIQGAFFSPWELDAAGYGTMVGRYFFNIRNCADWRG